MLLSRVTMRPPTWAVTDLSAENMVDLIWLAIERADRVEHIHARANGSVMEIVFFTLLGEQTMSDSLVRHICERAARVVPALQGWSNE